MTSSVDIRPDHLRIVRDVLRDHLPAGVEVWVFGSRAQWSAREGSDLDLALEGKTEIDRKVTEALADAFEDSDLPYTVDVIDTNRISKRFRQIVDAQKIPLAGQLQPNLKESGQKIAAENGSLYHPHFPEHWERRPLFSLAQWVNGLAFRNIEFSPSGEPIIKIAEIKGGISDQTKFTQQAFDESVRVRTGDLLFAWSGQPETSIDAYHWTGPEGWLNQHIFRVTPGSDVDPSFFYYLLKYLKQNFVEIARNKQTTGLGHVTKQDLENIEAAIPTIEEQRTIASVLGALDDRIELNRRMNETLEDISRALFKSWFVDFDPVRAKMNGSWQRGELLPGRPAELYDLFPENLTGSEQGNVPEGWAIGTLGDIAVSPNRTVSPAEVPPETPYIGLQHMPRRSLALNRWEDAGQVTSNKSIFRQGALLFGKLRPYFHKVGIASVAGIASTDIVVVEPIAPDWSGLAACHLSSHEFVAYADRTSTGTRMPRTSWPVMKQYAICLPSEAVAREFQKIVGPLLDHIVQNCNASHGLYALQNILLPKLISGEIQAHRVRDEM